MDLRQLEYVVAVADTGGFTSGAAATHVAQPSLSARVRDLERELGVDLFHRVGRGSRLSAAGEVVIDHARLVLGDVRALRAAAAAVAGLESGSLDIVSLPTLAVAPLARLVGEFRQAHPRVVVHIEEADETGGPAGIAGLVRAGRAEIGLSELTPADAGLVETALADQELFAIGTPAMSLGRKGTVELRALAEHPLVLTPSGTSSRRVVDAAFATVGIEPRVAVEVAQREAVVPLVLAGAGLGFVPGEQAEAARAQGAVVLRPTPRLIRRIGLLNRPGRLSPAAGAFLAGVPGARRATRTGR